MPLPLAEGVLVFYGTDGVTGEEPWKVSAQASAAELIHDIHAGPGESRIPNDPSAFVRSGGLVYFAADDRGAGRELWAVPVAALLP
jgi:ELWxxDGT repeat protein